jgi:GNAT superfamily N-acetyltransferase
MNVRPATAHDVPVLAAILAANHEPMDWPDLPELGWPYLEHLVARARTSVAETDGVVAGFGGSVTVGGDDVRFVTDLFVDPARHERGAGRALLAAVLEGSADRMTFSSADERALALYVRAGMRPWWPLLYLEIPAGALDDRGRNVAEAGLTAAPGDLAETARWSRTWTGIDRSVDFEHYASLPEAAAFVVHDAGAVAAVGWARRERKRADGRWLDHATLAPDADPVRATIAVLRAAAAGGRLVAPVPGPHPALARLLELGARIGGRDQFCATDPGLIDPDRVLPNPGFV